MSLLLKVALSKEAELACEGGMEVSCSVQLDFGEVPLANDLDGLAQGAKLAFVACDRAVNEELDRLQQESEARKLNEATYGSSN